MEILQKVREVIAETLNVDVEAITPELATGEIEEWDSMGNVAIIAALEEQMEVEFPIEDLFELNSVEAFVNKIKEIKNA